MYARYQTMLEESSLAAQTRRILSLHPEIRWCLHHGLINASALARFLGKQYRLSKQASIATACCRLARSGSVTLRQDQRIRQLLSKANITTFGEVSVLILERSISLERLLQMQANIRQRGKPCSLIEGESAYTLVCESQSAALIRARFSSALVSSVDGLVKLTLTLDRSLEVTPGVVGYVCSLLGGHGINIREMMSCWTDLMLVVDQKDLGQTLTLLRPQAS